MEIKEVTIIDIFLMIIFATPAIIIFTRLWVINDAPMLDSTLIIGVFISTSIVSVYFLLKILIFIKNWWLITNAREMTTRATVEKSFLKTKLTVEELLNGNNSYERNYDGFEIEYSRNLFEKISMSTRRNVATNKNHIEFSIYKTAYIVKTKITDKELLQNNMFRDGQEYRVFEYHKKFFIEKNKIIYRLKRGKLNINNYNEWLSCNEV